MKAVPLSLHHTMSIQEEIRKRKEEIQLLIAAGNVEKAIKRSMDFATDFATGNVFLHKLIELNNTFNMLKSENGVNNLPGNSFKSKRDSIVMNVLELVDEVEAGQWS